MHQKEPVLLVVLIDTSQLRWLAGGITMTHEAIPLLASQPDDLADYGNLEFDEQTSFLRHRLCGVLQRGCDRLWGHKKKACHFVFLIDERFTLGPPELTDRIADHLVQWMANPPVTFFAANTPAFSDRHVQLETVAGKIPAELLEVFNAGLPELLAASGDSEQWEAVPLPKS